MTRPRELRALPDGELKERLESAKEELFNLRFQLATGQLDNPMRIKTVRHDIARIATLLRERELEILDRIEAGGTAAPVPETAPPEPRRRRGRRKKDETVEPQSGEPEAVLEEAP